MAWARSASRFLLRKTARFLITAILRTCRVSVSGEEPVAARRERGESLIYVFWHCHIFYILYHFRFSGANPLISLSVDGELIAQIASEFGLHPVRGSSSRGGSRALIELIHLARQKGRQILITADGPKGPARHIKPGALQLAAKSGAAVVPISWAASRAKVFRRSWDRFRLPLPFSRIRFAFGEPLTAPGELGAAQNKQSGGLLAQRLDACLDALETRLQKELQ